MPTFDELRSRYAAYSAEELTDLAARPSELTPEALAALEEVMRGRDLPPSAPPQVRAEAGTQGRQTWHRGWLTVFQAWITLITCAFVAGFLMASGEITLSSAMLVTIVVAVPITGLLLIARRHPAARGFWLVCLGAWFAYAFAAPAFLGGYSPTTIVRAAMVGAWLLYWLNSKRVAQEFRSRSLAGMASPLSNEEL